MDNFQLSELAQKAKDGDMAAFEKLYIELSPEIYAIACEITQNKEESCDLVQDCFVAAMENIETLNEPDKIKNWLIRIAANKSRDYIKKKKPSVLTEDQYEIIDNIEEEDIEVIPEASFETEERIEEVNEILGCLTEEKRLCLLLRFKYDMSYAEIAQELGITESAVKSRISRAKDDIEKEAEKRKKKGLPLFGIAPFGLVIFALKKSAEVSAASFAGSAVQTAAFAGVTAASQAGIAAASTAATATTVSSGAVSAAGTTATAATGVGAKIAAMSVAQKVVAGVAAATIATGSATVTTVVVKNKIEANTTTAYVEEVTTAPDYGFESETVFIPPVTEISTSESSTTQNSTSSENQSSTVTQIKETEKSTVANKTTNKSTTRANTTAQKQTTTNATTKTQTTTTTKATTTQKETTTEELTTAKATTTKAVTTKPVTTTTTTKAATTTTTEASSPATVKVTLHTSGSEETIQKILSFDVGESITDSVIEQRLMSDYGIDAMSDSISETAESGKSYTVDAFIIS